MSIDAKTLGERLRIARSAASLTQEQVAERLKLARTTIVAIERGDRRPRADELVAFAAVYGVSANSLLRETAVQADLVLQFRRGRYSDTEDRSASTVLQLMHKLATSYVELETRLDRHLRTNYPPERPIGRGQLAVQADDLAAEARSLLGLGSAPIRDIVSILELEVGMRVFVHVLPSDIAGAFAYHPSLGACVLVNRLHPRSRRAWTLAHEFGHLLTTRSAPDVCFIDKKSKPPTERFADFFAASFLMPAPAIRRAFSDAVDATGKFSPRQLILMAHRYEVSLEAMCRRLEQLDLVPINTYELLRSRGLNEDTVREVLGGAADLDELNTPPPRMSILAAEAYSAGMISEGQLVDMLAMDRTEVRRLLDGYEAADLGDIDAHGERE